MKLFKVTCILHVRAVTGPKGGYRCYIYIIRNTSDIPNYDKLYSIQCISCQPDPAQDMMNICYSRNESWRCLFLKMNKTAWKSHMYQGPHLYIWPWSMQIYIVFQFQPWLCNQRTHSSVTTGIAGNTVHSSCRYWRSQWVFPFLNHFFLFKYWICWPNI